MTTDPARRASTVGTLAIYGCAWNRGECDVSAAGSESGTSGEVLDRNRSESVPFPVRIARRKASVAMPTGSGPREPHVLGELPCVLLPPDGDSVHNRQCCVGIAD